MCRTMGPGDARRGDAELISPRLRMGAHDCWSSDQHRRCHAGICCRYPSSRRRSTCRTMGPGDERRGDAELISPRLRMGAHDRWSSDQHRRCHAGICCRYPSSRRRGACWTMGPGDERRGDAELIPAPLKNGRTRPLVSDQHQRCHAGTGCRYPSSHRRGACRTMGPGDERRGDAALIPAPLENWRTRLLVE